MANSSLAGLKWEAKSKTIKVHPLQASETVAFSFSNMGSEAVEITDLKPTCGCITGTVEKKIYQPGESGQVLVTFDLRKREGAQRKGIGVKTKAGATTKLYISTNIEASFSLSARRLVWESGEAHGAKVLEIVNHQQTPYRLKDAISKREGVFVELITKREGFEYQLVVTPDADLHKTMIPIIIVPETPVGLDEVKTFSAYALIK